jgi:hypothetical protein
MTRLLALSTAAALLAGCATAPPPLTASHPASPDAPEGAHVERRTSLRADEATRKSRAMLADAEKEQREWNAHGPVSGTPENAPKTDAKPEKKHDHHYHQ